jgi:hypothetical protein
LDRRLAARPDGKSSDVDIGDSAQSLNESHDSDEDIVADVEDENDEHIDDEVVDEEEEDVEHTDPPLVRYFIDLLFFRAKSCCRRTACLWLR